MLLYLLFRIRSQERTSLLGASSLEREAQLLFLVIPCGLGVLQIFANLSAAAVGGIYELVKFSSANLREKNDALNTAYGGFLAGTVLGLRRKTFARSIISGRSANLSQVEQLQRYLGLEPSQLW